MTRKWPVDVAEMIKREIESLNRLRPNSVTLGQRLDLDLNLDSLDLVELIMSVEEAFDIDIPNRDLNLIGDGTVQDLVNYVTEVKGSLSV